MQKAIKNSFDTVGGGTATTQQLVFIYVQVRYFTTSDRDKMYPILGLSLRTADALIKH